MQAPIRNPHFWHPDNFAKKKKHYFGTSDTICVFEHAPKNYTYIREKRRKKNLDQFLTLSLDQFWTLKPPNLGPIFKLYSIYLY